MDYIQTETVKRIENLIKRDNLDANFVYAELKKIQSDFR